MDRDPGTYMEYTDQMRLCPEDPLGMQRVAANAGGIRGTSYVINEYVADVTSDGYYCLNINFVAFDPHPSGRL